jgi:hypothetical protein
MPRAGFSPITAIVLAHFLLAAAHAAMVAQKAKEAPNGD